MRRGRVHVLGASAPGTTTVARALAKHWSVDELLGALLR